MPESADIDNPMWAAIEDGLKHDKWELSGTRLSPRNVVDLNKLGVLYSPTIPDPDTLAWIHAALGEGAGVVLADAGNGYWPYLLRQLGHEVTAYDPKPQGPGPDGEQVRKLSRTRHQIELHGQDVLMLAHTQPKYKDVVLALNRFPGNRMILLCEDPYVYNPLAWLLQGGWENTETFSGGVQRDDIRPRFVWHLRRRIPAETWNAPTTRLLTLGGAA